MWSKFVAVSKRTGVLCPELVEAPELPEHLSIYWDIYQGLRFSVNANGQIPVSEINAYCSLMNISDPEDRKNVLNVINGINEELSEYQRNKSE